MTNNTITNVPRELLADLLGNDHDKRIMAERHLLAMLANAPSPAGVDGLEVVADVCGDGLGFLVGVLRSGHLFSAGESLCRLSDAKAIIDGLRGENERIRLNIAEYNEAIACYQSERDQHAQRIGELEGLLRDFAYHTQRREMPTESSLAAWADRIEAALSAGKEGE